MIICDSFVDGCGSAKALNIPKVLEIYTLTPFYKNNYAEETKKNHPELIKKYSEESGGEITENIQKGKEIQLTTSVDEGYNLMEKI